jgi:uncharacterized membrane protein
VDHPIGIPARRGASPPWGRRLHDSEVDRWVSAGPMTLRRLLMHLGGSLWFVPVLCVIAGAAISFGTIALDRLFDYGAVPSNVVGDPNAARSILSTVAVSMVSLTTLVLTITMVVVQLAMGQFSPRIVQRILRDKPSQFAIGLFVATFVHAILTLREVSRTGQGDAQVPGIAILTAYLLVLTSIVVLVIYVQHIGQALRVSALVELVGHDTRGLVHKLYPFNGTPAPEPDETVVQARQSGVVTAIGYDELVAEASRSRCVLELVPALSEFVPSDAPLFLVRGDRRRLNEEELHRALVFKLEPTLDHDVGYGLRMLVDIAERSLSDSPFQDPTTAVQAIDRIHDILRQLARRPFPDGTHRDERGEVRLVVPVPTWEDYVLLATEEITLAGAGSPPVARRLESALNDLRSVALPDRVAIIDHRLETLAAAVADHEQDAPVMSRG